MEAMNSETPLTNAKVATICDQHPLSASNTEWYLRFQELASFAGSLELRNKRLVEALRKEWENRLELFEDKPHYVHSATCPNYCDYACNGEHGFEFAALLTDQQEEEP